LKQLKAWFDTDCMTRSQHKFTRISIDEELRAAKRNWDTTQIGLFLSGKIGVFTNALQNQGTFKGD